MKGFRGTYSSEHNANMHKLPVLGLGTNLGNKSAFPSSALKTFIALSSLTYLNFSRSYFRR